MKYHDAERMTLIELQENLGQIQGNWDGDLPGRAEDLATIAREAYEKIIELKKLLAEIENLA